jgi:hypothetical protein
LYEVVRQNPDWFVTNPAEAPRLEVPDESSQRRVFSDEAAVALPVDQVDIDINLADVESRGKAIAPVYSRDSLDAASRKKRKMRVIEPVPRGYQNWKRAAPEEPRQSLPAYGEVNSHSVAGALSRKFTLPPAGRMVRVTPTVLKDSNPRSTPPQPIRELRFCIGRDDRERDRNRPRNLYQSVKICARCHRIVITPP